MAGLSEVERSELESTAAKALLLLQSGQQDLPHHRDNSQASSTPNIDPPEQSFRSLEHAPSVQHTQNQPCSANGVGRRDSYDRLAVEHAAHERERMRAEAEEEANRTEEEPEPCATCGKIHGPDNATACSGNTSSKGKAGKTSVRKATASRAKTTVSKVDKATTTTGTTRATSARKLGNVRYVKQSGKARSFNDSGSSNHARSSSNAGSFNNARGFANVSSSNNASHASNSRMGIAALLNPTYVNNAPEATQTTGTTGNTGTTGSTGPTGNTGPTLNTGTTDADISDTDTDATDTSETFDTTGAVDAADTTDNYSVFVNMGSYFNNPVVSDNSRPRTIPGDSDSAILSMLASVPRPFHVTERAGVSGGAGDAAAGSQSAFSSGPAPEQRLPRIGWFQCGSSARRDGFQPSHMGGTVPSEGQPEPANTEDDSLEVPEETKETESQTQSIDKKRIPPDADAEEEEEPPKKKRVSEEKGESSANEPATKPRRSTRKRDPESKKQ